MSDKSVEIVKVLVLVDRVTLLVGAGVFGDHDAVVFYLALERHAEGVVADKVSRLPDKKQACDRSERHGKHLNI